MRQRLTPGAATGGQLESLVREAQDLRDFIARRSDQPGSLRGIRHDLEETASQIAASLTEPTTSPEPDTGLLRARLTAMLDRLDAGLRDYQRYSDAE